MPRSEFDSVKLIEGPRRSVQVAGRVTFEAGETPPTEPMRVAWVVQQQQDAQGFTGGVSAVNTSCEWGGATDLVPPSWPEEPPLIVEATGTLIVDREGQIAVDRGSSVDHPDAVVWTQVVEVSVE
jgi:hypothetical protein